jgi:hypothetical protein
MMFTEQIAKGAGALTSHFGNEEWRTRINIQTLDIADYYRCMLGQLFGGYHYGLGVLGLSDHNAIEHGFDVCSLDDVDALTDAWLDVL